jgi:hypothetical protein
MEILNDAEVRVCPSSHLAQPRFKVRPSGKDLAPLADCQASSSIDFS